MKKKWTWLSILFVILILQSQTLFAKENMKAVFENANNIKICFPESCYVLNQEVQDSDPYLVTLGADRSKVVEYYKENNIFLHAVAKDFSYEIVCTVKDNDNQQYLTDLSLVSEDEVKKLANSMADTYKEYGYEDISFDYYEGYNENFAVIRFTTPGEKNNVYCEQYYFVLNNKAFYFTFRSFDGEITAAQKEIMRQVADSIYFFRNTSNMEYIYTNEKYGISFEVPTGWEQKNTENSNQYLLAQFSHSNKLGETFQVYTYDIWQDLDIVRKVITTREAIDTTSGMEMIEANKSYLESFYADFSKVKIREGKNLNLIWEEEPLLLEHENIEGNYYQQNYCVLKQGILYVFQYGYYEESNLHKEDVESLLDTISIENPDIEEEDAIAYQEIAKFTYGVLAVIITVVLTFILLIFLYFKTHTNGKD